MVRFFALGGTLGMQDEQQAIEFWGPELLKAAVFDGISLTDGTL